MKSKFLKNRILNKTNCALLIPLQSKHYKYFNFNYTNEYHCILLKAFWMELKDETN